MEVSSKGTSPRNRLDNVKVQRSDESDLHDFDTESIDHVIYSMNALEILKETVRILRYNLLAFVTIAVLLICPVSSVLLSNVLVDESIVKRLTIRFLLVAQSSGFPLRHFIKQSCHRFSEMIISSSMCFPLYITVSLLSKAAVVYSVDCTYSRKTIDAMKFFMIIGKIWRRIVTTYLWVCMVIVGCLTSFFVLLVGVGSTMSITGFSSDMNVYAAMVLGLVFSVVNANAIIICNIGIVISVLEDVSGPQALLRASVLVRGQTHVGLLIYLGSTIGTAIVEGLFEHRVTPLSYGDGSSRIWEGPLLVVALYSLVVLIDSMMSAVFYFSCRSYRMEASDCECPSILETLAASTELSDTII